jgi:hypothetical protein
MTTDSKLIYLSSADGDCQNGSYLSHVIFHFDNLFPNSEYIVNSTIQLMTAQIPLSYYNINNSNNEFIYEIIGNQTVIEIKPGNYSVMMLIEALQFGDDGFIITLDERDGTLSFTLDVEFRICECSILTIIGLTQMTDSIDKEILCDFPLNTSGTKSIIIFSPSFHTENLNTNGRDDMLAIIPINQSSMGIEMYSNGNNNLKYIIKGDNLNKIELILKSDTNQFINFNSINWSVCLLLETTRTLTQRTTTFKRISNYLTNKSNKPPEKIEEEEQEEEQEEQEQEEEQEEEEVNTQNENDLEILLYNRKVESTRN